jgi:hypothetical protein
VTPDIQSELFQRQKGWIESRRHWLGLPVLKPIEGSLREITNAIPHFGRQPFAMASVNGDDVGVNPFLDMVYSLATRQGEKPIPVGVVSKNYRLVDHHQVLRTIEQALADNDLDLEAFHVRVELTAHGERAHFSVLFPTEQRFIMPVRGSEDVMRFRIEIFNSVEGSSRLMAVAGWLRLVCSNGLILGTALFHLRQQHRQQLEVDELGRLVREAIEFAGNDKVTFEAWLKKAADPEVLVRWIDEDVCSRWGVKAAVRVLGIVMNGWDVDPVGDVRNRRPSQIDTRKLRDVPGVDGPVENLFGISQVLSWIASQRAEIAEDLQWRSQVHDLMEKLIA